MVDSSVVVQIFRPRNQKEYEDITAKLKSQWPKIVNSEEDVGYDQWLEITPSIKEAYLKENRLLKPYRLKCFEKTVRFLESLEIEYWISDGTMLAVWRDNGVMIPQDYDCDISIMEKDMYKLWLNRDKIPEGCGLQTECFYTGIEWCDENGCKPFDPNSGGTKKFIMYDNRDFTGLVRFNAFVCEVDIYTYREAEENPDFLANNYAAGNQGIENRRYPKSCIFPLKRYQFEGVECWGPNDMEVWLKIHYGYLGKDCYYDKETKLFKKMGT